MRLLKVLFACDWPPAPLGGRDGSTVEAFRTTLSQWLMVIPNMRSVIRGAKKRSLRNQLARRFQRVG